MSLVDFALFSDDLGIAGSLCEVMRSRSAASELPLEHSFVSSGDVAGRPRPATLGEQVGGAMHG